MIQCFEVKMCFPIIWIFPPSRQEYLLYLLCFSFWKIGYLVWSDSFIRAFKFKQLSQTKIIKETLNRLKKNLNGPWASLQQRHLIPSAFFLPSIAHFSQFFAAIYLRRTCVSIYFKNVNLTINQASLQNTSLIPDTRSDPILIPTLIFKVHEM